MHQKQNHILEGDKIARVEGNGKILVEIEDEQIKSVKVNIYEGPRLVEEIIRGKSIDEVISIVPRICAICNLSHKLATVTAMQYATLTQPPRHATVFHQLMHMGEMIESHTLHLYLLVLPDFFGVNSAVDLLETHKDAVIEGLQQKKFANKIMYLAGGKRMMHGENPKVGGFGKYPSIETLKDIRKEARELLPDAVKLVEIMANLDLPDLPDIETNYICVDPPNNEYGFYGDHILTSTGKRVASHDYRQVFTERVVPHSFAKRALHEDRPFTVGALARIELLKDRLEDKTADLVEKYYHSGWKTNPLYNNMAQAIENVYCFEKIGEYTTELIELLTEIPSIAITPPSRLSGRGVGSVEAPRGLLIHDYTLRSGLLEKANIVTPTALNLDDIERHLCQIGQQNLTAEMEDKDLLSHLEMITRSYDPCISCSAHLVEIRRI